MRDTLTRFLCATLLAFVVVGATLVGFGDLMVNGPFSWHVHQPRVTQGAMELVLLALGVVLAERMANRRLGIAAIVVLAELYARRHAVDFAIALTALFALGLYSLGLLTARLVGSSSKEEDRHYAILKHFVMGVVSYTILVWLGALLFHATFLQTKIFACLLLGLSIVVSRPLRTLSFTGEQSSWGQLFPSFARAILIATLLAILAKDNYKFDYDSLWYGLRPDRILFGPLGLYQDLDLATQVYYYPKLYEVLIAPLAGNGDDSSALAFSAFAWLFMLACLDWAAKQFSVPRDWRWALMVALGTLPAAAAIAVSAKGELFAVGLLLLCLGSIQKSFSSSSPTPLADCAIYALLASTVRLSMLPYLSIVFVLWIYAVVRWSTRRHQAGPGSYRAEALTLLMALIAVTLVHLRTYLITGYPLLGPAGLGDFFVRLGFHPNFPAVKFMDTSRFRLPPFRELLGWYVFSPSHLNMATWTGNLWASLPAIAVLSAVIQKNIGALAKVAGLLAVGAAFFVIMATFRFSNAGGDGHFFLVPIAALLLASVSLLASRTGERWRSLPWALLAVSLFQFLIFFMSAVWYPGTRTLDANFHINPLDQQTHPRETLGRQGLLPVADAIADCGHGERVLGLVQHPTAFLLPGRYESAKELAWSSPEQVRGAQAFAAYLKRARIELMVVPDADANELSRTFGAAFIPYPALMRSAVYLLASQGQAVTVSKLGGYELYHIVTGYGTGACAAGHPPDAKFVLTDKEKTLKISASAALLAAACLTGCSQSPQPAASTTASPAASSTSGSTTAQSANTACEFCTIPATVKHCAAPSVVTVYWDYSSKTKGRVVVYVVDQAGGERGFGRGAAKGSKLTGPWVKPGLHFRAKDAQGVSLGDVTVGDAGC